MSNDRAALEELFRASTPGAVQSYALPVFSDQRRSRRGGRGASGSKGFCNEKRLGADGRELVGRCPSTRSSLPRKQSQAARKMMESVTRAKDGEYGRMGS